MFRIINPETGLFVRDDFTFDPETEVGLDVEPAQGFFHPKWDGKQWVEGKTQEEIDAIKASAPKPEPTLVERLAVIEAENALLKARLAKVESTDTVKAELIAKEEPFIKDPIIKDPILTR